MIARDATTARRQLRTLLFCAMKTRSNLQEAVGTDSAGTFVLQALQPWLFDPSKEFVSRLYDRLEDPRPIDPTEHRNFFLLVFLFVPIIKISMFFWGDRMPKDEDELLVAFEWPEEVPA